MAGILLLSAPAAALDPALEISQYGHRRWTFREAGFKSYPKSIVRTSDGYLWFGTEFGLLRFDGVRFVLWEPPAGARLPSDSIDRLLAGRDGSLWIGTALGLARWKDGRLAVYGELSGRSVTALVESRDGGLWAGTHGEPSGHAALCEIRAAQVSCDSRRELGPFIVSLHEDSAGSLWVGAATGLWRWKPGPPEHFQVGYAFPEVRAMADSDSNLLVAVNRAIYRLEPQKAQLVRVPLGTGLEAEPTALLRDRDGGMWVGTKNGGVIHLFQGREDRFGRSDGLSGDFVTNLLEDAEGNIWVTTLNGVDRFSSTAVVRVSTRQGLSSDSVISVLAATDGSVWFGSSSGLNRWHAGRVARYTAHGAANDAGSSLALDGDGRLLVSAPGGRTYLHHGPFRSLSVGGNGFIWSMVHDRDGALWISDQDQGLLELRNGKVVETMPWVEFGDRMAQALAADPVDGGLWLGFFEGGVSYLKNGKLRTSYTEADGLGAGRVNGLFIDEDRALWVATQKGVSRVKDGAVSTLTSRNGLPCETVHWAIDDEAKALWLRTSCGLVRIERPELDAWIRNPNRTIDLTAYDETDGVPGHSELSAYSPSVSRAPDGRIWFVTYDGAAVIDPKRLPRNTVVPPVHIEQVSADGVGYAASGELRLPPRVRDLRIDYTALSLVAPSKVRFRYMLEGRDVDWVDAQDRRQAFYTDLPPATYRFRVIASNDDGLWNETGDVLQFSIEPMFYETKTFQAGLAVCALGLLFGAYRLRLRTVAARINARFEERLAERTRIAQDLHDTLLQGNLSASMQLHVLAERVTDPPVKAKLERILERFSEITEEGRRTVQELRTQTGTADDLEQVLAREAERLKGDQPVEVRIAIHGRKRPIHALVRDECYRIAREALANVFRHAHATRIDVSVDYGSDLRLRIRDNGRGVEQAVLDRGRPGHWGVKGMRERAERIGATIRLQSHVNAGTSVELVVPGWFAFVPAAVAEPQDAPGMPPRWLGSRLRP